MWLQSSLRFGDVELNHPLASNYPTQEGAPAGTPNAMDEKAPKVLEPSGELAGLHLRKTELWLRSGLARKV